jgi:hypothetical protein
MLGSVIRTPCPVTQCPKIQRGLTADWGRRPSLPSVPISRKKAPHYPTLDVIGDTPTRPGDKAGDLSLDLLLTRLKNSAEDASEYPGLVCVGIALGRILVPEVRAKIPVICCISHVSISIGIPVAKLNLPQPSIFDVCTFDINEALDNGYLLILWLSISHA